MRKLLIAFLLIIAAVCLYAGSSDALLPYPYDTPPYQTGARNNSACRDSGGAFHRDCPSGWVYNNLVYWLGTEIIPSSGITEPGTLVMDFATPFSDVEDRDFAVLTGWECWGPYAGDVRFDFYMNDTIVGSMNCFLLPNSLNEFELPGTGIVANRILLVNTAIDPPGINNDACIELRDAGISRYGANPHPIPEPSSLILLCLGLSGTYLSRKRISS